MLVDGGKKLPSAYLCKKRGKEIRRVGEGRASELFLSVPKSYAFRGRLRWMMAAVIECLSISQLCFFCCTTGRNNSSVGVLREAITNWRLHELKKAKRRKKNEKSCCQMMTNVEIPKLTHDSFQLYLKSINFEFL